MAKVNGEEKKPSVKMQITLVLETEETKHFEDGLKPMMYLEIDGIQFEELVAMCRDKNANCPFCSMGCPFNHKKWQELHKNERCTKVPCEYVTVEDWKYMFDVFLEERRRKEDKFWEEV